MRAKVLWEELIELEDKKCAIERLQLVIDQKLKTLEPKLGRAATERTGGVDEFIQKESRSNFSGTPR